MGKITALPVAEGDRVTMGQVLAQIDRVQVEADAAGAFEQLKALEAEERAAREQLKLQQPETILRQLRKLPPGADNDFALLAADSIIATFDSISARIAFFTVGLAAVSLLIGAIGIANVMFISVTERTREIGLRRALGASQGEVLLQYLLEAAFLSGIGGVAGVATALLIGLLLTLVVTGFSAVAPLWAVTAALARSVVVGLTAGYWPARRAAMLDPVETLRHD